MVRVLAIVAIALPVTVLASDPDPNKPKPVCWRQHYSRGLGKLPSYCDPSKGLEESLSRCYPKCKDATPPYTGVGPECWQDCAENYTSAGPICYKTPWHTYAKHHYARGSGQSPECHPGKREQGHLCFTPCKAKYNGTLSICWGKCPSYNPVACGTACCRDQTTCDEKLQQITKDVQQIAANAAAAKKGNPEAIINEARAAADLYENYEMPTCGNATTTVVV